MAVLTTTSDDPATSSVLASEKREVRTGDNGALVGRLWLDYCGDKLLRISRKYDLKHNWATYIDLQLICRLQLMIFFRRSNWGK